MPELEEMEDALSACESQFERDLMQSLLERGYRVQGQVGSIGYLTTVRRRKAAASATARKDRRGGAATAAVGDRRPRP